MTISPLAAVDALIAPICIAANRLRQVRDSLPVQFWTILPPMFREPVDALFLAVENYDSFIGRMRDVGLMPAKDLTPGE